MVSSRTSLIGVGDLGRVAIYELSRSNLGGDHA